MRRYETTVIVDPDISDDKRNQLSERTKDLIASQGGLFVNADEWGNRKLAYEIKKKPRGYYVCLDFCGTGKVVDEIERNFRIDDKVMKFMTILIDKDVNIDAVKEEMAKAETERVEAAKAEAEKAEAAKAETEKAEAAKAETEKAEAAKTETEKAKKEQAAEKQAAALEAATVSADETSSEETVSDTAETETAEESQTDDIKDGE